MTPGPLGAPSSQVGIQDASAIDARAERDPLPGDGKADAVVLKEDVPGLGERLGAADALGQVLQHCGPGKTGIRLGLAGQEDDGKGEERAHDAGYGSQPSRSGPCFLPPLFA